MKKFVVMFVLVCFSQFSIANEKDEFLLEKAKSLVKVENYAAAIPLLKQYINELKTTAPKEVYLELANAYFGLNNQKETLAYIKIAISKAGLTEQDFIYSNTLNEEVSSFVWEFFYNNYDVLRKEYLSTK